MKFLLSIYGNDEVWSSLPPEQLTELIRATDAHNREMTESGELLFACGVAQPVNARKVRRDDAGSTIVSDGPHIETKEYLGSFYIVDCDSLERALELAAAMPSATLTDIEVKQIIHGGTADDLQ
jgi:hypothetical protein